MNIALLINKLESTDKCLEILLFCLASLYPEDIDLKIRIYYNLAYTYHRKDVHDKALSCSDKGINICIENNNLTCLALLYSRKGIAEYFLNNDNHNISLTEAMTLFEITGQDNLIVMLRMFYKKHNLDLTN